MTDTIAAIRRDNDRFVAAMEKALADVQRALRRAMAEAADDDDDPRPSGPGAASTFERYPGQRMRRVERSRSAFGYEMATMPAGLEYRCAGRVERVR